MSTLSRFAPSITLFVGIFSIAATLLLEMRRERRRSRLVQSLEATLNNPEMQRSEKPGLQRAA
jgi:hypothetical protein